MTPSAVARRPHRFSLFAQPLDRAAFVAYFLGAVVPLAALAWVVRRWAWPALQGSEGAWSVLGVLVSIAVLSLVSFLALRRTAKLALARLDRENQRLQALLRAARALSASTSDQEILRQAVATAATVSGAHAAFHLVRQGEEAWQWGEATSAGERPARESLRTTVQEAAEQALESLAPAIRGGAGGDGGGGGLAVAIPCAAADGRPGALAVWHDEARPLDPGAVPVLSTLAAFATVALRKAEHHATERNFYAHATNLLVSALDAHLAHQTDHSRRVAQVSNQIGRRLGLSEARLERLHFAALLHDIGMLRVDRRKVADLEAVREHPALGAQMLEPIRVWEDLAPLVRHHHEWFDGSGYPHGLAGSRIPLESRIIAVAETWDALTAEQSYQRPVGEAEALERIEAASGVQFDPEVVRAFRAVRAEQGAP